MLWLRRVIPVPPTLSYEDDGATPLENAAVSYSPTATGTGPLTYALAPGSDQLPSGLTLDPDTGIVSGVVSDLAYEEGPTYAVVIRVTGAAGTADANLSLAPVNVLGVSGARVQYLAGLSDGEYRVRFISPVPPVGRTIVDFEVLVSGRRILPSNVTAIYAAGGVVYDGFTPTDPDGDVEETLTISRGAAHGAEVDCVVVRNVYDDASKGSWLMLGFGVDCVVAGDGWPEMVSPTLITQAMLDAAGDGPYVLPGGADAQYLIEDNLTVPKYGIAANSLRMKIFSPNENTLHYACAGPSASGSSTTWENVVYGVSGAEVYGLKVMQGPVGTHYSSYAIPIAAPGAWDNATSYGIYREGTTISVPAGQGSIEATIDALVTALNASVVPEFAEITWTRDGSGDSSRLVATFDTVDTPFKIQGVVAGGAGGWGYLVDLVYAGNCITGRGILRSRDATFHTWGFHSHGTLIDSAPWEQPVSMVKCHAITRGLYGNRHAGWFAMGSAPAAAGNHIGSFRLQRNTLDASHGGIRCRFNGVDADNLLEISHNTVTNTGEAGGTNGYGLMVHGKWQAWHDNLVFGNRRGIHTDGADSYAHALAEIIANVVDIGPEWNEEYGPYDVHGYKHEFGVETIFQYNSVTVTTEAVGEDDQNAHALNIAGWDDVALNGPSDDTYIKHNFFKAIAPTTARAAVGFYVGLPFGDLVDPRVAFNVFHATTRHIQMFEWLNYDAVDGDLIEGNLFLEEGSSAFQQSIVIWNGIGDAEEMEILDSEADFTNLTLNGGGGAAFSYHLSYTLTVYVHNNGTPVAGATVTVKNAAGVTQFTGTTDANGILRGKYRRRTISGVNTGTPTNTDHGDAEVTVDADGFTTYVDDHAVAGTMALRVRVDNTTAAVSTGAPSAPTDGFAAEASCHSVVVGWAAPADIDGIHSYRVSVAGVVRLVTQDTYGLIPGLTPATEYDGTVEVTAVGYNGVESTPLVLPTFITQAEIRGAA